MNQYQDWGDDDDWDNTQQDGKGRGQGRGGEGRGGVGGRGSTDMGVGRYVKRVRRDIRVRE